MRHTPKSFAYTNSNGYRVIRGSFAHEHRWIISRRLGRGLKHWEHVHHMDENKQNNRDDNLLACTPSEHAIIHKTGALPATDILERNKVPLVLYI